MRPLFSIWLKPRKTFEYLINLDYEKLCNKLDSTLILLSISLGLLNFLKEYNNLSDFGFMYLSIIAIISIASAFIFLKFVYSYVLLLFSKLFQGKAEITQIRIVVGYAFVPFIVYLFISIALIVVAMLFKDTSILIYENPLTYYVLGLISLRILIIGLSYFNKYSYGYGLLTILIPTAIIQLGIYYLMR